MSSYTSVILIFCSLEDEEIEAEEQKRIVVINKWLKEKDYSCFGEDMCLNNSVYIGNFKHFNLNEFVYHLRSLSWKYFEDVQVFVCNESDEVYQVIKVQPIKGFSLMFGEGLTKAYEKYIYESFFELVLDNAYTETTFIAHPMVKEFLSKLGVVKVKGNIIVIDECEHNLITDSSISCRSVSGTRSKESYVCYYKNLT